MADRRIMQLPQLAPADIDAQVWVPVVDDGEALLQNKNKRIAASALVGNGTGEPGTGTGGSFTGFIHERFTQTPYTTLLPTSYANISHITWGGRVQEYPSQDNSYSPDLTLTFNQDGTVTINGKNNGQPSEVSGDEGQIVYVAGGTIAPTEPPAPVTGLAATAQDHQSILSTWTNP